MSSLQGKVATAEAMLQAGNLDKARLLCREILEKEETNLGAFECLFQVRVQQEDFYKALMLTDWRLERLPECTDAHLSRLVALGALKRKRDITALYQKMQTRFPDRPHVLEQAQLLHSHHCKSGSHTRKLVIAAREKGALDPNWLDILENAARSDSGQIFASRRMLRSAVRNSPEDHMLRYELAVTEFLTGHLPAAIRHAKQGRRLKPVKAAMFNEVIFASYLGLTPVFWGVQLFIVMNASIVTRLFWLLRIPFNYFFFFLSFILPTLVFMPIVAIFTPAEALLSFILILNLFWIIYLLFGFQRIGQHLARRKKQVKLSDKY